MVERERIEKCYINLKKIFICLMLIMVSICFDIRMFDRFCELDSKAYAHPDISHVTGIFKDLRQSDILLCLSFVKSSDMDSRQLVDFIMSWKEDRYKRVVAAVFRNKITRVVKRLQQIRYEDLVKYIDFIKATQLEPAQILKLFLIQRR